MKKFRQVRKMVRDFQNGDILMFIEIENAFNDLLCRFPDIGSDPRQKKINEMFANITRIPDQKKFLDDTMLFVKKILSEKNHEKNSGKNIREEQTCIYPQDYFVNLTDNAKILETYYTEVREQLEKAPVLLLELEHDPDNTENLNTLFRVFHTIKGSSGFLGLRNFEEISHEAEEILSKMRDGTMVFSKDLADILFYSIVFFEEMNTVLAVCEFNREKIAENFRTINIYPLKDLLQKIRTEIHSKKIGEILIDMGKTSPDMVSRILLKQQAEPGKKFGEVAVEMTSMQPQDIQQATRKQLLESRLKSSYVKVASNRLNDLVNLVGELVVTQSILREEHAAELQNRHELHRLEAITSEIKELVLNMGMVPISDIFNRLRVAVRNTARELSKSISVEIEGEGTELDRNLVESIYDPLLHIVRNSVDHGIEMPKERETLGKPAIGKIFLSAKHSGNGIIISVRDDGSGMDHMAILEKALEMKIINEKEYKNLSDNPKEAIKLILHPGFSIKTEVSEISGRGVGMDIVQKNIGEIQGRLEISTCHGEGSEFQIKLPLTLAIIDGFVVSSGNRKLIFPFNAIEEIVVPDGKKYNRMENGETCYEYDGRFVRVVKSSDLIMGRKDPGPSKAIVFLNNENQLLGVEVDEILGKQEIVIKKINELLQNLKLFSGGTIFGDGSIGFIVDLEILFSNIRTHKEAS
ncbi:MAG: chemotaxis protein CheA [Spirochaetales bacterium]|nr:chemotaxis protein CheA [Spirochaetales bacterium]